MWLGDRGVWLNNGGCGLVIEGYRVWLSNGGCGLVIEGYGSIMVGVAW